MLHIYNDSKGQQVKMTFSLFPLQRRAMWSQMCHQHPMWIVSVWHPKCHPFHLHTCPKTISRRRPSISTGRKHLRYSRFKRQRFATQWPTSQCRDITESLIWYWIEALMRLVRLLQSDQPARDRLRTGRSRWANDWSTSGLICRR